jgi:predicted nucleic acid-binding protein
MAYLIDSDLVIDHLADDPAAQRLLDRLEPYGLTTSMITYMEVHQGTLASPDPEQAQARLGAFLATVPIVSFSAVVARRCARLRTELYGSHSCTRSWRGLNPARPVLHSPAESSRLRPRPARALPPANPWRGPSRSDCHPAN